MTTALRRVVVGSLGAAVLVGPAGAVAHAAAPGSTAPHQTRRVVQRWVIGDGYYKVAERTGPGTRYRIAAWRRTQTAVWGTVRNGWLRATDGRYINTAVLSSTPNLRSFNGDIPARQLRRVPKYLNSSWHGRPGYTPSTQRYVKTYVLPHLLAMDRAYRQRFGKHLSIDLTYRDLSEQRYWWRRFGAPRAAYPGTSVHGYGLAIDFWENPKSPFRFGRAGDRWLSRHSKDFGFNRPKYLDRGSANPEYWHVNFIG